MAFGGAVYAANEISLVVNGKHIQAEVAPRIVDGTTLVPIRAAAEALGAAVSWDGESSTVQIQDNRTRLLEAALAPNTANEAAGKYAEAVKTRNGALQYAVMSDELKEQNRKSLEELNWVTGTSSPWVADYKIERTQGSDTRWTYQIHFIWTSSTGEREPSVETIVVEQRNDHWFVTQVGATGEEPASQPATNPEIVKLNYLTSSQLVQNALKAYWHVMGGGQQVDGAAVVPVIIDDKEYRHLGEDIDTQAELSAYLGQYYTAAKVKEIIANAGIIEHDGKLVQPNADGGSLLNLNLPLAEEVDSTDTQMEFEFKFEIGDTTEHVPISIQFTYENGWKLSTTPKTIYQAGSR
jgi:hypothetical protein